MNKIGLIRKLASTNFKNSQVNMDVPGSFWSSTNASMGENFGNHQTLSIWDLVQEHVGNMVDHAVQRARMHILFGSSDTDSFASFKERLLESLMAPLSSIIAWGSNSQGHAPVHKNVEGAVAGAVDEALQELNVSSISNTSLALVKRKLVVTLDSEIELAAFNKLFTNDTAYGQENSQAMFHGAPMTDATLFITLVCVAIIVPAIFITLIIFFYKRQQDSRERRQEMLLQDQGDFSCGVNTDDDKPVSPFTDTDHIDLNHLDV